MKHGWILHKKQTRSSCQPQEMDYFMILPRKQCQVSYNGGKTTKSSHFLEDFQFYTNHFWNLHWTDPSDVSRLTLSWQALCRRRRCAWTINHQPICGVRVLMEFGFNIYTYIIYINIFWWGGVSKGSYPSIKGDHNYTLVIKEDGWVGD